MQPETKYQCRHIFTDGRRCQSPCLRQQEFCYYHHTTRKPIANPKQRRCRSSTFQLPLPDPNDRSGIQQSIGEVLQRIAANDIDPRRAGLLLYGLQIASLNLPKQPPNTKPAPEIVEEITTHPELGILAPPAELGHATRRKSTIAQLLETMLQSEQKEADPSSKEVAAEPATLPTLQAAETDPCTQNPNPRSPPEFRAVAKGGFGRTAVRSRRRSAEPWKHGVTIQEYRPGAPCGSITSSPATKVQPCNVQRCCPYRSFRTKRRGVWSMRPAGNQGRCGPATPQSRLTETCN